MDFMFGRVTGGLFAASHFLNGRCGENGRESPSDVYLWGER
jgi:hypothetical protein